MTLSHLLRRAATVHAHRPAQYLGLQMVADYQTLARRSWALGEGLRRRYGLAAGDRVVIFAHNHPAYTETLFALWHVGLVAVPVNAKLHPNEVAYVLDHCAARVAFVSADLTVGVDWVSRGAAVEVIDIDGADYAALASGESAGIAHPAAADDLAWIFYTSGTTGRPKGAMLTHRNLLTMTACYVMDVDSIAAQDCLLHAAPMSHGSGLYILPHVAAAAAQVIPESGGFDTTEIVDLLDHHTGMSFFAAPTMVHRLTLAPEISRANLENLKTIIYGGAPMYQEDLLRAQQVLGPCLAQIYGQGESPMTITALSKALHAQALAEGNAAHLNSAGVAQTLAEVAIAGPDGTFLPTGEQGEILVRGDAVMAGYWDNPTATAAAIRDGWLYTGDMGSLDQAGYLTLKDRSKDVIISGGSNIYPREVEEVLLTHPGVREVSVIGVADADWGEVVTAYVVGDPTATAEALDQLCLTEIARFKRPKTYRFVESLPKNAYGKVLKTELRLRDDKG